MTYELAKKLKDAGYKQGGSPNTMYSPDQKEIVYIPTLSELIKACGDDFSGLIINRGPLSDVNTKWSCAGGRFIGLGSTPEEAVANLWLSLQELKKKE